MKRETRILWSLLLLSPALGELLSGSCPPLRFFHPLTLLALVLFYGGATVLIREARVRWRLQWPVLFLAVAYAIWEEGSTVQSFFNPNHPALGALSGYGLYGGIQWPWAIGMVFYHATMSTLVPIAIVDLLWPDFHDVPLLRRRGIVLTILGVLLARMAFIGFMRSQEKLRAHPYQPDPVLVIGSVAIVGLLVYLAHRSRRSVVVTCEAPLAPPPGFAIVGFVAQGANLLVPIGMAASHLPAAATVAVQLVGIVAALAFVFGEIFHRDRATRHLMSLVIGSVSFYIAASPLHEFGPAASSQRGMMAVGLLSLVLLVAWRNQVVRASVDVPRSSPVEWRDLR